MKPSDKPLALSMAQAFEELHLGSVAAELRRLHARVAELESAPAPVAQGLRTAVEEVLRLALVGLANAADAVGVRHFDSDDLGDEVQAMRAATTTAREVLSALAAAPAPVAQPLGFMNAGHIYELQQKRLPYGYVYPDAGVGADVAVFLAPAPVALTIRQRQRQPGTPEFWLRAALDCKAWIWDEDQREMAEASLDDDATPAPVAQQPLSLDAVKAILTEAGYDTVNVQGRCDFIAGLRHGEAAHGITGNATAQEGGAA